ncbi:MAG: prepilin-type cleavage/methylation domain-containing protein [Variovorax paradoxus]|nr:MAG: prepilin-type cleavage/methylation domain-containing protein [Variovorax paradoxus]PZQ15259.1 MAG: prepilin-type cleavage/methylation domain-containing protein [Variovorax paradoxus]
MSLTPSRRVRGFTLIELMITVAIAAILVAVALPNYTEYVRRGARSEARAALLQAAQWMERGATARGRYPIEAGTTHEFPAAMTTVPSGRYVISAVTDAGGGTFTLTATPQGAQVGDKCGSFTLTHTGERGRTGTETVQNCWNR